MNRLVNYTSRRCISISTLSDPIKSNNKTITTNENIQNVNKLNSNQSIDAPSLTPIDHSVLSIDLPPSVPIYTKRGSLISIFGISNLSTSTLTHSLSSWGYQRLVSTSKISLLMTSNSSSWFKLTKTTNNKAISILNLDGTNDWAVFNAPHFYIGDSIIRKSHWIPRTISRKFARALNIPSNTPTGLANWFKYSYTILTGRGQVGVIGKGAIYNVNLVENEEILINKKNLLAITVNGPSDLQNCIVKYETEKPQTTAVSVPQKSDPLMSKVKYYLSPVMKFFGFLKTKSTNYLIGNQEFVKVIGPRNILIQSDINYKIPEFPSDDFDKSLRQFKHKANDYLNYVKVGQDKSNIISTKNFEN